MYIDVKVIKEGLPVVLETKTYAKTLKRIIRNGMKIAVKRWYSQNIHRHFTNRAFFLYPIYRMWWKGGRKRGKEPLVKTGTLKRNITSGIKVTSKRGETLEAKATMQIGRPGILHANHKATMSSFERDAIRDAKSRLKGNYTKKIEKKIINKVRRNNAYSKKSIDRFRATIPATNEMEAATINKVVGAYVLKEITKPRRKRKSVKRLKT